MSQSKPEGGHIEIPYAAFCEWNPDAILIVDCVADTIVHANRSAELLLGLNRDKLLGHTFSGLFADESRPRMLKRMQGRPGAGPHVAVEEEMVAANGNRIPVEITATLAQWAGDRWLLAGFFKDIAARKTMDRSLKTSEERWHLALQGSGTGVWDWDVPSNQVFFSDIWQDILGYENGEISPSLDEWKSRIHPDHVHRVLSEIQKHLDGKIPSFEGEYPLRGKDGRYRWVYGRGRVIFRDPQGRPLRAVGTNVDISRRKRIEEQLLEERDRMAVTLRSIGDGVIATDPTGAIVLLNLAAELMTGWFQAEALGKPLLEVFRIFNEATGRPCEDPVVKVLKSGAILGLANHTRLVARDGTRRIVADSAAPILDLEGKVHGVVLVFRDTTEQHAAEEALRESERLFKAIFERSGVGMCLLDLQGRIIDSNLAFQSMLGYGAKDLAGKTIAGISHPEDRKLGFEHLRERLLQGHRAEQYHEEKRYLHKNGQTVWGRVQGVVVRDANDRPMFAIAMIEDITSRKLAEEALRASEARNRAMVSALPDMMFRLSREGVYLDFHSAREDELAAPPNEIRGRTLSDILPSEVAQSALRQIEETLRTQKMQTLDYKLLRDGQTHEYEARLVVSGPDEVLSIVRDVTNNRRLEEEMARSEKFESMGVLAGGIAHDFNNYLTAVLGTISMSRLAPGTLHPEVDTLLREIEKATLQAKHLTQQLLMFAKGGAPVKQAASLEDIIRESATFALRGALSRCFFEIAGELPQVEVDEGQISQVIQNLVLNSDQAMRGGGKVIIHAAPAHPSEIESLPLKKGRYVRISISDSGAGIPAELLGKVFDPYFTTKQEGSGLGLTTAFTIIKRHGGHLTLASKVGTGTTVTLFLPALDEPAQPPAVKPEPTPEPTAKGRVLIMDDEPPILHLASEILSFAGFAAETAADGAEAIERFRAALKTGQPFDVVLLDMAIPGGIGGREALLRMREMNPAVKAVVSSGYSSESVHKEFKDLQPFVIVAKPYRVEDLINGVTKALNPPPA